MSRAKKNISKDTVSVDILNKVAVEDYEGIILEQDAELYEFRKRLEHQYFSMKHFISSYKSTRMCLKISWKSFL